MAGLVLIPTLVAMLTIPGWTLLTLNQSWRYWQGLQRWIVAVGLSIAFYPILYYAACLLPTSLSLDLPSIITALLVIGALTILWRLHSHWKTSLAFDRLEWTAIIVFGMTMLCRLWIIGLQPYPAWSDSLHHTLLTQLTAEAGRLPGSLEPYFPISLEQYHLGLYAISGTLSSLAQVPAHTALLWAAQVLNGLCGLGIYLVLDRKAGRIAAVTGAIVVGLLSHQPAFYVNWGRFTQLASQTIMPIAWLVTWETIAAWRKTPKVTSSNLWLAVVSAMLNAAVFLLHFRVAAFYIPPLAMSISYEVWQGIKQKQVRQVIMATGIHWLDGFAARCSSLDRGFRAIRCSENQPSARPTDASRGRRYNASLLRIPLEHDTRAGSPAVALGRGSFQRRNRFNQTQSTCIALPGMDRYPHPVR